MVIKKNKNNQSVALYRRIALSFILLSVVLIILVVYLSFSEADIIVFPREEIISASFIATVQDRSDDLNSLPRTIEDEEGKNILDGYIFDEVFEKENTFLSTGKKQVESANIGTVTIYNYYTKDQPLVATTRLLAPDGQIFRIRKYVVVPYGGKIDNVEIYADDVNKIQFPLAKTRFVIPGLWEGLQDKIYAENEKEIQGQTQEVKIIIEEDINLARQNLEKEIIKDAADIYNKKLEESGKNLKIETTEFQMISISSSENEGDEVGEFLFKEKARVVGIAFSRDELKKISQSRLVEKLSNDKELDSLDISSFTFKLSNYDEETKTAEIQVYLEGGVHLRLSSPILDKNNFSGKTKKEVVAFLTESSAVKDVEIKLRPFWLTRVPKLLDHINIVIKRIEE